MSRTGVGGAAGAVALALTFGIVAVGQAGTPLAGARLTASGLGPIHVGMTVAEAERASGHRIKAATSINPPCGGGELLPRSRGVSFLLDGRTIESITLNRRGFRTLSGARVGDTLRRLKGIYGSRLRPADRNIGGNPVYEIPAGARKVRFDMYRGRVMFIVAGLNAAADAKEGCL